MNRGVDCFPAIYRRTKKHFRAKKKHFRGKKNFRAKKNFRDKKKHFRAKKNIFAPKQLMLCTDCWLQGCQIFIATIYKKIYQMTIKYTK
jgi:hypothetical protein